MYTFSVCVPWCTSCVLVYIYRGVVYFLDSGLLTFVLVTKVKSTLFFSSVQRSSEKSKEKESAVRDQWHYCEIPKEPSLSSSSEGTEMVL
jgi:hypothetical protein